MTINDDVFLVHPGLVNSATRSKHGFVAPPATVEGEYQVEGGEPLKVGALEWGNQPEKTNEHGNIQI